MYAIPQPLTEGMAVMYDLNVYSEKEPRHAQNRG